MFGCLHVKRGRVREILREFGNGEGQVWTYVSWQITDGTDHLTVLRLVRAFFVVRALVELRRVDKRCLGGVATLHTEAMEDFSCISRLRDVYWASRCRAVNVHAKEPFDRSEVVNCICFGELFVDFVDTFAGVGQDEEIVNVDCNNGEFVVVFLSNEKGLVRVGLTEAEFSERGLDVIGPEVRGLFETI